MRCYKFPSTCITIYCSCDIAANSLSHSSKRTAQIAKFWSRSLALELIDADAAPAVLDDVDIGLPRVMVNDENGDDVESSEVGSIESRLSIWLLLFWLPEFHWFLN